MWDLDLARRQTKKKRGSEKTGSEMDEDFFFFFKFPKKSLHNVGGATPRKGV